MLEMEKLTDMAEVPVVAIMVILWKVNIIALKTNGQANMAQMNCLIIGSCLQIMARKVMNE